MQSNALYARIQGWVTAPFSKELDLMSFVLFTMLALTVSYFWTRVLHNVFGD